MRTARRSDPRSRVPHPTCRYPVTWEEAESQAGQRLQPLPGRSPGPTVNNQHQTRAAPKRWKASDLNLLRRRGSSRKNRIPRGAVTILCGDEGIGKSLLWVLIVVNITTGKPFEGFGIPARTPERVILVITEDDWQTAVLPRLIVAGADLDMIEVICADDDGSGSPIFPAHMELIPKADPKPAFVVGTPGWTLCLVT